MALPLLLTACEDELDRVSEVKTVRVLGVRKTPTYPAPGEQVEHSMLWHDGRRDRSRPVQITWLAGCNNPPADRFYGCFGQLAETFAGLGSPDDPRVGFGDTFSWTVPDDLITSRPPLPDPNQPQYGSAFVFFAACAGELRFDPNAGDDALPMGCFDGSKRLGAEDFVLGYTVNFAYQDLENAIPAVLGFRVAGKEVAVDCVDEDCVTEMEEADIDCTTDDPRCIDACAGDGDVDTCPEIAIEPIVDPSSVEKDPVASQQKETTTYEQVWVDYFADRGRVDAELRLIGGADDGPRDDYASRFYAPAESGPIRMWAVAKDSRGGVSWVRLRLQVK